MIDRASERYAYAATRKLAEVLSFYAKAYAALSERRVTGATEGIFDAQAMIGFSAPFTYGFVDLRDAFEEMHFYTTVVGSLPHFVAGVVRATTVSIDIRFHVPGEAAVRDFPKLRTLLEHEVAKVTGPWMYVAFVSSHARCVEHEECEKSYDMGALCWRSKRGERV